MSLHIVEGETGSLMPATYEFQDRFLAKRTKALFQEGLFVFDEISRGFGGLVVSEHLST